MVLIAQKVKNRKKEYLYEVYQENIKQETSFEEVGKTIS